MKKALPIPDISSIRKNFINRIRRADFNKLPISDYSKVYLNSSLAQIEYLTDLYTALIFYVLQTTPKKTDSIKLIDYGGGPGLFSVFAKLCGISTVVYNDIYPVSCRDFVHISNELEVQPDEITEGDIDTLIKQFSGKINVMVSMDVVEHIYNQEYFFSACPQLHPELVMVHYTGANPHNPVINRRLKKHQAQAEYMGFEKTYGHKERDNLRPFFELRKEIIAENFPQIREPELSNYAMLTRGLRKEDILINVKNNLSNPSSEINPPDHTTNTCDPFTGNWEEHLVPATEYAGFAKANGFQFTLIPSFYNTNQYLLKKIVLSVLNRITRVFGTVWSAPGFFLIYKKSTKAEP